MMASISTKYWHYILSQGFVTGIGLGSAFTPAVACVSSYYKKRRGFANGMYSSGSAIGGLVIPIFLSKMINNPKIGLAWALRTSGFVCFLFYGVAWLIVRQKKVPTPSKAPLLDFTVFRQRLYCIVVAGFWLQTFGMFVSARCGSCFSYLVGSAQALPRADLDHTVIVPCQNHLRTSPVSFAVSCEYSSKVQKRVST